MATDGTTRRSSRARGRFPFLSADATSKDDFLGARLSSAVFPRPISVAAASPEHAASEADRLLGRPTEFGETPIAISGIGCWGDWFKSEITVHDGLVGRVHPRLRKAFDRPMSATSLKLLLRDPIRFVWRYALGWKQPDPAEEPITLDALAFGGLVHERSGAGGEYPRKERGLWSRHSN